MKEKIATKIMYGFLCLMVFLIGFVSWGLADEIQKAYLEHGILVCIVAGLIYIPMYVSVAFGWWLSCIAIGEDIRNEVI